ncbi:MAG: lipocalin family protein [Bacteroidaceae bacterium]
MNKKHILLGIAVCLFGYCSITSSSCTRFGVPKIAGTWTQPIPGMPEQVQGFTLNADGTAESVNMATLKYNKWKMLGYDTLVLCGTSIGNGTSSYFADTLIIETLTEDSLHLMRGIMTDKYARLQE